MEIPTDEPQLPPFPSESFQKGLRAKRASVVANIEMSSAMDALPPQEQASSWRFVEAGWFQLLSAGVILVNTIMIAVEADNVDSRKALYWAEQATMCFYVCELFCRVRFFRAKLLCGPRSLVLWNVLDIIVVGAGVADQWVLPSLAVEKTPQVQALLAFMRLLRLFRVLKVVRIFLESDLSWTEEAQFQSFIGGVIAFNALLMGMETDIEWAGWFFIEQVLLAIYVFELAVRLKRFGLEFLSCSNPDIIWNVMDMVIVLSSAIDGWLIPLVGVAKRSMLGEEKHTQPESAKAGINLGQMMMLMRMLRLLRILRLAKLVKSVRPLYVLVVSVTAAVQGVAWVLVLTIVTLYAMGILTTRLIGHGMAFPEGSNIDESLTVPFKTVADSMFTLFRVMSGAQSDAEAAAMDELMARLPTIKFAFVFFMVTSSWTLLSILTAVVSENMITTTGQQEEELKIATAEEDRRQHIKELKELFSTIDITGDGTLEEKEILGWLNDRRNMLMTAKKCRVPVRDVVEVLKTLSPHGESIDIDRFVECMCEVGRVVTEKSVMKIEARLLALQRACDASFERLDQQIDKAREEFQELTQRKEMSTSAMVTTVLQFQRQNAEAIRVLQESMQANSRAVVGLHDTFFAIQRELYRMSDPSGTNGDDAGPVSRLRSRLPGNGTPPAAAESHAASEQLLVGGEKLERQCLNAVPAPTVAHAVAAASALRSVLPEQQQPQQQLLQQQQQAEHVVQQPLIDITSGSPAIAGTPSRLLPPPPSPIASTSIAVSLGGGCIGGMLSGDMNGHANGGDSRTNGAYIAPTCPGTR